MKMRTFFILALSIGLMAARALAFDAGFVEPEKRGAPGTFYKTFQSKTIKGEASYRIYLPPDYEQAKEKRYPVIYYLHGLGGTQNGMAPWPFLTGLDAAIKAGKAPGVIVVFVNGLKDSRYYDSYDGERPVESVTIKDLIPHIDATYRTLAERKFRAIEGFSMGGFGTAHLAFKYPELFGTVSIMSGALLDDDTCSHPGGGVSASTPGLFQKNFGGNLAYFHAGSPWVVVREHADQIRGKTLIRIRVGDADSLLSVNTKYHELLDSLKIENDFATLPGVKHNPVMIYDKVGIEAFTFYQKAFGANSK